MTADGKIAAQDGQSKWITGALSRQYVHHLRSEHQAILTTVGTVMADNPQMTVRDIPGITRQPVRVILDRQCRLNPDQYRIFDSFDTFDTQKAPTWVFISRFHRDAVHTASYTSRVEARGGQVFEAGDTGTGLDLAEILDILGKNGIGSVFTEAGGRLAGSFTNQRLVQKLVLFYAPRILSDAMAIKAFSDSAQFSPDGIPAIRIARTLKLDKDRVIEAYPENP